MHLACHAMQVLEGYLYLGNLQQLGAEIATAFTNALDETCLLQVGLLRSLHRLQSLLSSKFTRGAAVARAAPDRKPGPP